LEQSPEAKIGIKIDIHNFTTDTYHVHKVKIGELPEQPMNRITISPNSNKSIDTTINGTLSSNLKYVKGKLYLFVNSNSKPTEYSKKKILNPHL